MDAFFVIFIVIILFFLNLLLAIIFLILVIFFLIFQQRLIKAKNNLLNKKSPLIKDRFIMKELGSNEELLKSTHSFKYTGFYIEKFLNKKLEFDSSIAKYDAQQISSTSYFILIFIYFNNWYWEYVIVNGNLSIGSLIGFNIFATRAIGTISSVQNSLSVLEKINVYLEDCKNFFKDSKNRAEGMQLSKLTGNINLNDISYVYDTESKYVIKNFSTKFSSSKINVISGKNGSGKSTLAKLVVGLLKPESGNVSIDDTNLDKLSLIWFKENVAYIPQESDIPQFFCFE